MFAVGATPVEWTDMVEEALAKELPSPEFDDVERFYLRGGFAYERLGLPDKLAMKLFFKMQEKNAAADPRTAEMLEGMRGGFDGTDRAAIAPVAARVRALDAADLFWPGLALALVNGVANLVAAVLFARSDGRARSWALLAGALLIVWCVFELVYLPNPVSVIYLVIGLVQTACAVVMRPAR